MIIKGLQKLTLLDYKGFLAATIFTGNCNFICPYCHNKELVQNPGKIPSISEEEVISFLEKRKNQLEAVCISGGEPTLQPDLAAFISKIRALGYKIKLDTNGYQPKVIKNLLENKLLDYIAMDIKNSPEKYSITSGIKNIDIDNIESSIKLVMESSISYEFRTTIIKELHDESDIYKISKWIQNAKNYTLQSYRESEGVIHPGYSAYPKITLEHFLAIAKNYIKNVSLIGI